MNASRPRPAGRPYTARLLKGGALLSDMRRLMLLWDGSPDCAARIIRENQLSHGSRARARDVIEQVFLPRYVRSTPPDLWRPLGLLERASWTKEALIPLHYYAAAVAEPLLWDFACDHLRDRFDRGFFDVRVEEVQRFLAGAPASRFPHGRWGESATQRVARAVLTALRDFGILQGSVRKRMAPLYLPLPSFAFIAFIRHLLGARGALALADPCWGLFRLNEMAVERLFIEAHQSGLLSYHAAGSVIRIEFPNETLEEYGRALAESHH